jgi:hypothetical protein
MSSVSSSTSPLDRLTFLHKRTLVGDLLHSDSSGLGFGQLKWMERVLSFGALRGFVLADNSLTEPTETEFVWRPDQVTARYTCPDLTIDEVKTVHDDVLIDRVTIRNATERAQRISLVFRGKFEARKASARYIPEEYTALIDLSVAQRVHVAIAVSMPPNHFLFRPYPNLIDNALLSPDLPLTQSLRLLFLHDQIVPGLRFDFELAPGASRDLTLVLACDTVAETASAKVQAACGDPMLHLEAESKAWAHYFEIEIPTFRCSDPNLEKLWLYNWFVQRSNIVRHNNPRFPWAFQIPSKHTYPHLWFWDSAFHALINRWLRDPQIAHNDLRTVALQQLPNGMIPHEVYLESDTAWDNWPDGDGQASSITQLPIYAYAVWETYRVTRDRTLIADLLPALLRYDEWCAHERDGDGDGLITLVHRWEGWDTSPRWDWGLDVEPVDVNCFYFAQKQAIANIARELGDEALATRYSQEAERVMQALRTKMWDREAQTFFDLQGPSEMRVRVRTPAAFIVLPFGIADASQAESLFKQLFDPQLFWSNFPIPTVALNEPTFSPHDYWRGPVWFNQNWLVLEGLRRYKRDDLAVQLLRRSLDLLTHTGRPSAHEHFNPLTGEELGAADLGWTGLCLDMIVRHVCGVQHTDDDWHFAPLDIGLDWYELKLPAQKIHVHFDRQSGYRIEK